MTERVIQWISDSTKSAALNTAPPVRSGPVSVDKLNRQMRDLRISVTDRCNFRCVYCMPKQVFDSNYPFLPQSKLLRFEEIHEVARAFVDHGVEKIRLTGGEPLLRKNLEVLIEMLAGLRTQSGNKVELALTTNGTLLRKKAKTLKAAGLDRVTVSLDALSDPVFKAMNDVDFSVDQVLDGIEAAEVAGLGPVKVNMVVKKGMNDQEIVPMAKYFKSTPHVLRFIEYMDVGASNGWKMDEVLPSGEVLSLLQREVGPLESVHAQYSSEVAKRWRYKDGQGEIGLISSVTQAFCRDCSRVRLSTDGKLYSCLFANQGTDLMPLLRPDAEVSSMDAHRQTLLGNAIVNWWVQRGDRYSETRTANTRIPAARVEMSYIGG